MRMMMKVQFDTEAASKALADGSMPQFMQEVMGRLKPEAAYFGPEDGVRTAFIVFDMQDPSELPAISEPFFALARMNAPCRTACVCSARLSAVQSARMPR